MIYDTILVNKDIIFDDDRLVQEYSLSGKKLLNAEQKLNKLLKANDEENYLALYLARLAYEFAKEENDLLFNEVSKRGLITDLERGA